MLADIIILFLHNNNEDCILSWSSTKIKRILKSSTAAECLALIKGIEEALYLKAFICDIPKLKNDNLPIIAMIENKNLNALTNSDSYRKTNAFELIQLRLKE